MSLEQLIDEMAARSGLPGSTIRKVLDELATSAARNAEKGFIIPGMCELRLVRPPSNGDRGVLDPSEWSFYIDALPVLVKSARSEARKRIEEEARVRDAGPAPAPVPAPVQPEAAPAPPSFDPPAAIPPAPGTAPAPPAAAAPVESTGAKAPDAENLPEGLYSFSCPNCGEMIDAVPDMAGLEADCPFCEGAMTVPGPDGELPEVPAAEPLAPAASTRFLTFHCSVCDQEIEVREDLAGREADCPSCGSPLRVPASGPSQAVKLDEGIEGLQNAGHFMKDYLKGTTIRIELPEAEDPRQAQASSGAKKIFIRRNA